MFRTICRPHPATSARRRSCRATWQRRRTGTRRIIYPRVFNQRIEAKSQLISNIIQLEVLNGCGTPGIANSFTEVLRKNGFDVVETGNFDRFDVKESLIISRSGVMENAYRVANALGIKKINIIREESPDYYLDVTLVIGEDFKQLNTQ